MSPTEIAIAALRKEGWTVAIVERWNQYAHVRQDLYGWCDLLAVRETCPSYEVGAKADGKCSPGICYHPGTLGVQVTSAAHAADHRAKMQAEPRAALCVRAGWAVELWTTSTRRPEAGPCNACDGTGVVSLYLNRTGRTLHAMDVVCCPAGDGVERVIRKARCKACRGTGKGPRPKTMRHHVRRERMTILGGQVHWHEVEG